MSLAKINLADNFDLGIVLREFEDHFIYRFGRPPTMLSKAASNGSKASAIATTAAHGAKTGTYKKNAHRSRIIKGFFLRKTVFYFLLVHFF